LWSLDVLTAPAQHIALARGQSSLDQTAAHQ